MWGLGLYRDFIQKYPLYLPTLTQLQINTVSSYYNTDDYGMLPSRSKNIFFTIRNNASELVLWYLSNNVLTPKKLELDFIYDFAFNPDKKWIVIAGNVKTENNLIKSKCILYNLEQETTIHLPLSDQAVIFSVAWSSDGKLIAAGGLSPKFYFWDLSNFNSYNPQLQNIQTFKQDITGISIKPPINRLLFDKKSEWLIAKNDDRSITCIWDTVLHEQITTCLISDLPSTLNPKDEELLKKLMSEKFNYKQCLLNYLIFKASLKKDTSILMNDNALALWSTYDSNFKDFLKQTFPNLKIESLYEPEISDLESRKELFQPRTPVPGYMYKKSEKPEQTLLEQLYNKFQQFGSKARTLLKEWLKKQASDEYNFLLF